MRQKTLFLGNGLNRTLADFVSWEELMNQLGSAEPEGSGVPFPIEFEQIAARKGCSVGMRNKDPYKELRTRLAQIIDDSHGEPERAHMAFRNLAFEHFVTTNYDCVFEQMYDCEPLITNAGSSRNILGPISRCGVRHFYHAHGITKWKSTMCLGHEHYATLIGKIRSKLYTADNEAKDKNNYSLQELVKGCREPSGIWPELLFTTDVAIVGLGLDYSESDIWWLLALRAALFAPYNGLSQFENVVTYYNVEVDGEHPNLHTVCKLNALESLGVQVERVTAPTYKDAYVRVADRISCAWS